MIIEARIMRIGISKLEYSPAVMSEDVPIKEKGGGSWHVQDPPHRLPLGRFSASRLAIVQ